MAYVAISRLLTTQQWVTHTREVQVALGNVTNVSGRAGRALIEYIDSWTPGLLQVYESAAGQIPGALQHVRQLTTDNPTQQANCTRLESLIDRRISLMASWAELKKTDQSDLQKQSEMIHQMTSLAAETDSLLQKMDDEEQRLLNLRTSQAAQLFRVTVVILSAAFALALALLLIHYWLLNAELKARQQAEMAAAERAQLLDLANDAIFLRDLDGTIVYWNKGAERLYQRTKQEVISQRTETVLQTEFPAPVNELKETLLRDGSWEGELIHTKRDGSRITVASRWTLWRDDKGKPKGWLESNTDITERKRAEEGLRDLSGRLLKMQDEERRRIARELHDSAGQILAALSMKLTPLTTKGSTPGPHSVRVIEESLGLVSELTTEVRTVSHLLHPPLLDEVGLSSALRLYLDGFAERSKIKVDLEIPDDFGRLSQDLETAIFRIVQESLTNIHRHSGSAVAKIRISRSGSDIRVEVEDKGKGIPPKKRSEMESASMGGVGIRGMQERIRQLGGALEINSDGTGTLIVAHLPVGRTTSTAIA
ncbi:MAG: PAS domain S-box protein [Candidatus Sulfotelmatobacter sp.]